MPGTAASRLKSGTAPRSILSSRTASLSLQSLSCCHNTLWDSLNWRGQVEGYPLYIPGGWTSNHLEVTNSATSASAWTSYRRLRQLIELSACELSSAQAGLRSCGLATAATGSRALLLLDARASGKV